MSFSVTLDGKPVDARDIAVNVDASILGSMSGTFEIANPIAISPGDTIKIGDGLGSMSGIVTSISRSTASSTTSGAFMSASDFAAARRFSWPDPQQAISREDYAVIDEVIIDSVVRGYVQRRRDAIDPA